MSGAGGASVIVTWNVRHFTKGACRPHGIGVQTPDQLLTAVTGESPQVVLEALERQSSRYTSPPIPVDDILRRHAAAMPQFVAAITARRAPDGRLPSEGAG